MMEESSSSYGRLRDRLEEIVEQVRSKDVPLEKSLDLYEEALRLGSLAAEMIDHTDFSQSELLAHDLEEELEDAVDLAAADLAAADPAAADLAAADLAAADPAVTADLKAVSTAVIADGPAPETDL